MCSLKKKIHFSVFQNFPEKKISLLSTYSLNYFFKMNTVIESFIIKTNVKIIKFQLKIETFELIRIKKQIFFECKNVLNFFYLFKDKFSFFKKTSENAKEIKKT